MSSNFNNAKIINVYYNKGDRKPYDVNGKPIAYIGEEFIGANEATEIRFFFGEELDSASAIIVAKRANNDTRLDPLELVGTGVNAYFKIRLNAWYAEYKGKMTIIFKVYNGTVTYDDAENPTQITATTGQIIVSDIFNLEVAYAPNASSLVPPFETEDYDDWFFTLSTKLDKAQSITVTGALPTLTGDVYDDRYFYVENEGVGRLYYINGSTAIEVVFQVGTLRLTPTGNGDITADTGKLSWNQPNGTAQLGLYNDVNIGLGEDVMYYGKASATITKGQVIQFGGYQGDHILMKPAVPAEINANPKLILGIAKQAITSGDFGYVAHFGKMEGYDSGAFAVGSLLWFNSSSGSNGLLTATQPTAPNAKILMAALIKAETSGAANNGVLQVRIDIEPKLEELQNVLITSATNGNVLSYDGTKWVNSTRLTTAETDIDALEGRMTTEEGNVDSLESRMTTAEGDIDDIEDGTTIVPKALADQNNDVIDTTYLKIASATATYIPLSQKGVANGVVPLGSNGKVPSIYLSGEQDDLAEFADLASFPAVGETDILYVALDTNKLYRWSGSAYVVISETLAIGTTNTTAFAGDRGLALETLTDNIVDGDQALALKNQVIRNTVVGTSPLVVNSIASTTANLTEFQVNGTKVLEVTPAGNLLKNGNLFLHNTGSGTTGVGDRANRFGGTSATAVGHLALFTASSTGNTAVGHASLFDATGGGNTVIGESAGRSIITGANNTFVGNSSGYQGSQLVNAVNSTALGNGSFTDKSNQMVFGNASVSEILLSRNVNDIKVGVGIVAPTYGLEVFRNSDLVSTGSATPLRITGAGSTTNSYKEIAVLHHRTTATGLADGFGGFLRYTIEDSASGQIGIARIGAIRSGANTSGRLVFDTNNAGTLTEKMTILPNGNVGIGTASPTLLNFGTEFTLRGAGANPFAYFNLQGTQTNDAGSSIAGIYFHNLVSGTNAPIASIFGSRNGANNSGRLVFVTANAGTETEKMTILATGLVGIGTSSPTSLLTVGAAYGGTPNGESRLAVQNSGNTYMTIGAGTASDSGILFADSGDNDVGVIGYNHNTNHMSFVVNASERLRITSTGKVGIGTTSPTETLHITSAGDNGIIVGNTFDTSGNNWRLWTDNYDSVPNTNFLFKLSYGATDVISSLITGLVGIGTNAPTAQLQVKSGATTRVPLIVDTISGFDQALGLEEFRVNTSVVARINGFGSFATLGSIFNLTNINNANITPASTGTSITRNVADTNPALIVNLSNASATGNIQVWQKAGSAVAQITNTGIFVGQSRPTRTDITANATLALADEGKVLRVNSASNLTVTIPLNSSVAFPTDTEIAILRYGTGTVSISPTAGVTLNSKNSETKISGQYGSVALKKIGENEWVLVGSLEA